MSETLLQEIGRKKLAVLTAKVTELRSATAGNSTNGERTAVVRLNEITGLHRYFEIPDKGFALDEEVTVEVYA